MSRTKVLWASGMAAVVTLSITLGALLFEPAPTEERCYESIRQGKTVHIQLEDGSVSVKAYDIEDDTVLIRMHIQLFDSDKKLQRVITSERHLDQNKMASITLEIAAARDYSIASEIGSDAPGEH